MIVSFSVSNFRSFNSEATLSLVASKRSSGTHDDHTLPIPGSKDGERVLRTAVLYGANGAGKSNLLKAFEFFTTIAIGKRERRAGTGREPFFTAEGSKATSNFDLQFIADGKLYRYGVKVDDERITEEWLAQVIGDREKIIFERVTDQVGKVAIRVGPQINRAAKAIHALAEIGGPQNQSFLATVNATVNPEDVRGDLRTVIGWFDDSQKVVTPDSSFASIGSFLAESSDFHSFASEFLRASSTGVEKLVVQKRLVDEDSLFSLMSSDASKRLRERLASDKIRAAVVRLPGGKELTIERAGDDKYYEVLIQAEHEDGSGHSSVIDLSQESDGTKRLLDLLPALHDLRTKGLVYVIDEIDRSMHPMLVWEFLKFFLASPPTFNSQMIITTHESNLLDLDLLRRDEIWFVQKDGVGATQLYSLSDYKVRKDLEIRKHYLQGRFGAIPFLGDLNRLILEGVTA